MIFRNILTVAITLLLFVMMVLPETAKAGDRFAFRDVDPGGSYAPYIRFLSERGVIKGYPDGTFGPEKSLTRAEVVTALCVATGMKPSVGTDILFTDVPADHWAAGYIGAGVKEGILKGYPDGAFLPENMVSRAELAALLVNLSGLEMSSSVPEIPDVPEQHWARGVIDAAVSNKFFQSSPGSSSFNPDTPASRDVFARGAALAMTSSPTLGAADLIGQVSPIAGNVSLTKEDKKMRLDSASAILPGNEIRTGEDGEAEISFGDGTAILIKPNTRVIINKAKGQLGIREKGEPVVLADELEIKLLSGTIIGTCMNRTTLENPDSYARNSTLIASEVLDRQMFANFTGSKKKGRAAVNVVMPWGTVSADGFWTNNVTFNNQSTSVLMGRATVTSNGSSVTLKNGETTIINSSWSPPEAARQSTGSEAGVWSTNQQWITSRAERIERVRLVNVNPASKPVTGPQQPQVSLLETLTGSINSLSGSTTVKVPGGGGGGGATTTPTQDDASVDFSMDYNNQADGYLVNIYIGSLANTKYIEYTFEYDNTKLMHRNINLDFAGIMSVFGGQGLSISDILNDSGWIVSGNKTSRTIKSRQLSTLLNYSGSRVRLLSLDYQRINPGAAVVSIKNIKVSNGSTTKNMPDVTITLP